MSVFTVKVASLKKELEAKDGRPARAIYALKLVNGEGEYDAEWFTNATTPMPDVGSTQEFEKTWNEQFKRWDVKRPRPSGGGFGGGGMTPERQRAIQRQHSQEMAIRVLDILQRANGKTPDGATLRRWADWFDADVDATSAGTGGGGPASPSNRSDPSPVAGSSAQGFNVRDDGTSPQRDYFETLLKKTPATPDTVNQIMAYAETLPNVSGLIDLLKEGATANVTARQLAAEAQEWATNQPAVPEADTRDLPEADGAVVMPDDEDIPF